MEMYVTFQPIDLARFQKRVFGYLRGTDDLDDYFAEIRRVQAIQYVTRRWVVGIQSIRYTDVELFPDDFDDDVTCVQRPYLTFPLTAREAVEVIEQFHRCAGPKDAEDLARHEVETWLHDLVAARGFGWVKRLRGGQAEAKERKARKLLEPYRTAFAAGRPALGLDFVNAVLRFNELLQPAWTVPVWYTGGLFADHDDVFDQLDGPEALFGPLFGETTGLAEVLAADDADVGNVIRPKRIPRVRRLTEELIIAADEDAMNMGEDDALRRFIEVLLYCERNGLAMCERIS